MTAFDEFVQLLESMTPEQLRKFIDSPEVLAILGEGAADAV